MSTLRVVFEKWGGRRHWEYDARRLGCDDHGTWVGMAPGTVFERPGASFRTRHPQVALLSRDRGFVATFYSHGEGFVALYIDITTVPVEADGLVRMVDLDLDVCRGWTGRIWVDDEDEFAAHRRLFGYPEGTVRHAVDTCESVRRLVEDGTAPFDQTTADPWFTALAGVP